MEAPAMKKLNVVDLTAKAVKIDVCREVTP